MRGRWLAPRAPPHDLVDEIPLCEVLMEPNVSQLTRNSGRDYNRYAEGPAPAAELQVMVLVTGVWLRGGELPSAQVQLDAIAGEASEGTPSPVLLQGDGACRSRAA